MPHTVIQALQTPARQTRRLRRAAQPLFETFQQNGSLFFEVPLPRAKKSRRDSRIPTFDLADELARLACEQNYFVQWANNIQDRADIVLDNIVGTLWSLPTEWCINGVAVDEFSPKILENSPTYHIDSYADVVWFYTRYTSQSIQCLMLRGEKTLIRGTLLCYETTEFCDWLMQDDDSSEYPTYIERKEDWDFSIDSVTSLASPLSQQAEISVARGCPEDFVVEMQQVVYGEELNFKENIRIKIGFEGNIVDAGRVPYSTFPW